MLDLEAMEHFENLLRRHPDLAGTKDLDALEGALEDVWHGFGSERAAFLHILRSPAADIEPELAAWAQSNVSEAARPAAESALLRFKGATPPQQRTERKPSFVQTPVPVPVPVPEVRPPTIVSARQADRDRAHKATVVGVGVALVLMFVLFQIIRGLLS